MTIPFILSALTSLLPVVEYAGRAVIDRTIGPPQPTAADIQAQAQANATTLSAIGQMESSYGAVSPWVNNLRACQRPVVAFMVLGLWASLTIGIGFGYAVQAPIYYTVSEIASSIFFYLFGQRTMVYFDYRWFNGKK